MEVKGSSHGPEKQALGIGHPHHHAAEELALGRAVAMDGTTEKITVRAEEAAGSRVLFGKGEIGKDRALVLIHFSRERSTGGNRFAGKGKWPRLVFDHDIIAKEHAARTALPAVKGHTYPVLSVPEDKKGEGQKNALEKSLRVT